ncbi:hypothetical protein BO226_16890 [Rhodococcus sp. 2G]|nr:hypothetical protein BO226_16890 [Rhodococcus sp. 2G]
MVNRNDRAVTATAVAGRVVFRDGEFVPGYGHTVGTGRFLRAGVEERGPAPMRISSTLSCCRSCTCSTAKRWRRRCIRSRNSRCDGSN